MVILLHSICCLFSARHSPQELSFCNQSLSLNLPQNNIRATGSPQSTAKDDTDKTTSADNRNDANKDGFPVAGPDNIGSLLGIMLEGNAMSKAQASLEVLQNVDELSEAYGNFV